jgi:uncharacterized protein
MISNSIFGDMLMYIPQRQLVNLKEAVKPGRVVVLYGARRVGKTTLVKKYMESLDEEALFVNGDDIVVREYLESQSTEKLRDFVGNHSLLIVDEAQYIRRVGLNLKIIVDYMPAVRVIATGSSSFDLSNDVGEPLTGRKRVLSLLPLSQMELSQIEKPHETRAHLEARLVFGSYPEVVLIRSNDEREDYLREILSSYLFKDILQLEGVRYADKLQRLLQLLAFQIGNEVSLAELGRQLGMSKNTIERYLDLLQKVFVLYRRSGFSRNLRKEITKSHRYYFYDNGIRNALINNFNPLAIRDDIGAMWENYVVTERLKRNEYLRRHVSSYFWRTYDKKEIDLVEEEKEGLAGFEVKWGAGPIAPPKDWTKAYPGASFEAINRENYLKYIEQ